MFNADDDVGFMMGFLPIVTLHSRNCVANVAAITIVVWLAIDAMQGGWPDIFT